MVRSADKKMSDAPPDEADRLHAALKALPPRMAHLLQHRFVEGKTDDEVRRFYGMGEDAYSVHLLRAAISFTDAYTSSGKEESAGGRTFQQELSQGRALRDALATGVPEGMRWIPPVVSALLQLKAQGPAVRRKIEQAAAVEAASPEARRELWIRRLLVVVLLAVTALLYWRRMSR